MSFVLLAVSSQVLMGVRRPSCDPSMPNNIGRALVDMSGRPNVDLHVLDERATEDYTLQQQNIFVPSDGGAPQPADLPWDYYGDEDSLLYVWPTVPSSPPDPFYPLAYTRYFAYGQLLPGNVAGAGMSLIVPGRNPATTVATRVRHYDRGACSFFMDWNFVGDYFAAALDSLVTPLHSTNPANGAQVTIEAHSQWMLRPYIQLAAASPTVIYEDSGGGGVATLDRLTFERRYLLRDSITNATEEVRISIIRGRVFSQLSDGGALDYFQALPNLFAATSDTPPTMLGPANTATLYTSMINGISLAFRQYWHSRRSALQLPPTAYRVQMYPTGIEEVEAETTSDPNFSLVGNPSARCGANRILPTGTTPSSTVWTYDGWTPYEVQGTYP